MSSQAKLKRLRKGPTTLILTRVASLLKRGFAIDHFVSYYPFKGFHL
jgi:hypothetical protein